MIAYYKLRCAVMELFYGTILAQQYSIGQAADRCLVDFGREISAAGPAALVVLSCLLARVARHERPALTRFATEIEKLHACAQRPAAWEGFDEAEKARMREDLRFIRSAAEPG